MYEGRTAAKPGIIFGHENLGIVEKIGSGVTDIKVGDRVVMSFNIGCGHCRNCEEQYTGFCTNVNPSAPMKTKKVHNAVSIGNFENGTNNGSGQANL